MGRISGAVMAAVVVFIVSACSTTPGDAALRGGRYQLAAEMYQKGAAQNDAMAAFKLGMLLENGKVAEERFGAPLGWFQKACDLGYAAGCHNAGVFFEYGQSGASKDLELARKYYTLAAEQGYMQSRYNLGSLYANQYFVDNVTGLKWLLLAQQQARQCSTDLCKWMLEDPPGHVAKLRSLMSADEIRQAESQAAQMR